MVLIKADGKTNQLNVTVDGTTEAVESSQSQIPVSGLLTVTQLTHQIQNTTPIQMDTTTHYGQDLISNLTQAALLLLN